MVAPIDIWKMNTRIKTPGVLFILLACCLSSSSWMKKQNIPNLRLCSTILLFRWQFSWFFRVIPLSQILLAFLFFPTRILFFSKNILAFNDYNQIKVAGFFSLLSCLTLRCFEGDLHFKITLEFSVFYISSINQPIKVRGTILIIFVCPVPITMFCTSKIIIFYVTYRV